MERVGRMSGNLVSKEKGVVRVAVTGAAGNIGYALSFMIGQGAAFGINQPVALHLIELPAMAGQLKGVEMELKDAALPLLVEVKTFTSAEEGFAGIDFAVLVGAKPRTAGMERGDLLTANAAIFKAQAEALDRVAKPDTKVLVVGNPANTNAAIIASMSKKLKKENITALTRLDMNRLTAQICEAATLAPRDLRNAVIWGNHSSTQYPDARYVQVRDPKGNWSPVAPRLPDASILRGSIIPRVQKRGAEIISARKASSAASAAAASCAHLASWFLGTPEKEHVSMAVWSDGNPYGVPPGLIFSFPVTIKNGKWSFVKGLDLKDPLSQKMIAETTAELSDELKTALDFLTKK